MKYKIWCAVLVSVVAALTTGVSAEAAQDTTAPVITSIVVSPQSIDTTSGSVEVTFEYTVTDDLSGACANDDEIFGCSPSNIFLQSPAGQIDVEKAVRISGGELNGRFRAVFRIPQYAAAGNWNLSMSAPRDTAGNQGGNGTGFLSFEDLESAHGVGSATLTNTSSLQDLSSPSLTSFTPSQTTFDTTNGDQEVTVAFTVTDDLAGLCDITSEDCIEIKAATSEIGPDVAIVNPVITKVSGTNLASNYEAQFTFPRYVRSGEWYLSFSMEDLAGNKTVLFPYQLDSSFGAGTLTNTATIVDVTVPVITNYTISPTIVNTTNASQDITFSVTVTDDLVGVRCDELRCDVSMNITSLTEDPGYKSFQPTRVSGDENDGVYQAMITLPKGTPQGNWKLNVAVSDHNRTEALDQAPSLFTTFGAEAGEFTNGDIVPPTVTSIKRHKPLMASTDATRATLRVSFSEAVKNVDLLDFVFIGSAASSIAQDGFRESITKVSDSTYDILVSKTQTGTLALDLGGGNDITDFSGNALASLSVPIEQEYTFTPKTPAQLHRFYSSVYKGHFYTTSEQEKESIIANDPNWTYEGVADSVLSSEQDDTGAVHRFWSEAFKHHFYTISEGEKQAIIDNDPNWAYEGESYYAYNSEQENTKPMYRFYSPKYKGHFYTVNKDEKDFIIANDSNWNYEGIAWYVGEEW